MELLLPEIREPELALPSYVKLDMAFGVGSGTHLFDKSRYRSHGAITGAVWAAGLHGYCLDFDPGIPSYVEIPAAHTQLDFTTEDFSLIIRFRLDTLPAEGEVLFCRGAVNQNGYYVIIRSIGRVDVHTNQLAADQSSRTAAGVIITGVKYTLGFSRDDASIRIYLGGVDVTTVAGVHIDPATSGVNAYIGAYSAALYPSDGKIEFLRVFGGVALTASEHLAWHRFLV